ncbi:hypothetical protein [Levilactobacillus brevis]|uniref:hypothetical protein n=1 Tax=Levilactobacillus brevis TaxID=1580 RepID=UPI002073CCEB|nr:hypothetical protein [Levilactobacillus brevis]
METKDFDLSKFKPVVNHTKRNGFMKRDHDFPVVTINNRLARFNTASRELLDSYKYIEVKQNGSMILFHLFNQKVSGIGKSQSICKVNSNYRISFVSVSKALAKSYASDSPLELSKFNYKFGLIKVDARNYAINLAKPINVKKQTHVRGRKGWEE